MSTSGRPPATNAATTTADPTAPPAKPDDAAKPAPDQQAIKDRAFVKINLSHAHTQAQNSYRRPHGWRYWDPNDPNNALKDPDANAPGFSGVASNSAFKIRPGTYLKKGSIPPILAQFDYDPDTNAFKVQIDIRQYGGHVVGPLARKIASAVGANHTKWVPQSPEDWEKHAKITAKETFKCLVEAGLTEITTSFRQGHPFRADKGSTGTGSLAYAEKTVKEGIEQARALGVPYNVSDNFLQAVYDAKGSKERAWYENEFKKINENAKQGKMVDDYINPANLKEHFTALSEAVKFEAPVEIKAFQDQVDQAVKDQLAKFDKPLGDKIAKLEAKEAGLAAGKTLDPKDKAELDQARLDQQAAVAKAQAARPQVLPVELEQLKALQDDQQRLKTDAGKATNAEDLHKLKDELAKITNPDQPLKEAVEALKSAVPPAADRAGYDDGDKGALKRLDAKIAGLEKQLEKPLNNADRKTVEAALKTVIDELKILGTDNVDIGAKSKAGIEKAEQASSPNKGAADAMKRLDSRVEALEKAAVAFEEAITKKVGFDPDKLVGMDIDRKSVFDRRPWASRFNKIEGSEQAKDFFNDKVQPQAKGFDGQLNELQKKIKEEKQKILNDAPNSPEKAKLEKRLIAVEDKVVKAETAKKDFEDKMKKQQPGQKLAP